MDDDKYVQRVELAGTGTLSIRINKNKGCMVRALCRRIAIDKIFLNFKG
jgi:hypothetical protein